jgi:hypothetical protein
MLLARAPAGTARRLRVVALLRQDGWRASARDAAPVLPDVATEFRSPTCTSRNRFLLVTHDCFLSPAIIARHRRTPVGAMVRQGQTLRCPEADAKRGVFCYAAKHQPVFSEAETLAISYAANATTWRPSSTIPLSMCPLHPRPARRRHEKGLDPPLIRPAGRAQV